MKQKEDIYSRVTNQIIAAIELGATGYNMPWLVTGQDCFSPINAVSKRQYRGVNVLVLWLIAKAKGYPTGRWATFNQWSSLGARVRRGEKATEVVLWKKTPKERSKKEDTENESYLLARGFSVFNAAQVEGFTAIVSPPLAESQRIARAEQFFFGVGTDIRHGGEQAFYDRTGDFIQLPRFSLFRNATGYYGTLAHELVHWTGAPHRLDRILAKRYGDHAYALEEIVAELGAAFLCAELQLELTPRIDHAPYIAGWLDALRNDKRAIFSAASKAQQAADWLKQKTGQQVVA